ncbi:family 76 glycosyl hydrolase [Xylariales sp. PMI_506]|nr:family 76 glycosyl hydrolase [Xylariales sp. PMI_506]
MVKIRAITWLIGLGITTKQVSAALSVDLSSTAAEVLEDLLTFYHGDEPGWVPGILPGPPPDGDYYWWQGGAMWGAILDYRYRTGDTTYDDIVTTAMLFQVGDGRDYNPRNWSASMGNDDQAFWALSAMLAAETGYTDPAKDEPQWLALAQAVFNEQTSMDRRVASGNCEWGLRWQVYPSNNGYDYINTIANACYFNIGARLARYTLNDTYKDLAEKTFDLLQTLEYVDADWNVYDGAHLPDCTNINQAQFSYNAAMLLQGSAFMYNYTDGNEVWKARINGLLSRTFQYFFPDGVAFEPACESTGSCNADMRSFKSFLHRWLGDVAILAPFTRATIEPILRSSVAAGVAQCTGGTNGRFCGFHWSSGVFDGVTGAGQQMNVLGGLTALLALDEGGGLNGQPFLTNTTGGTSIGDPNAGIDSAESTRILADITTGDRAGAGILTTVLIAACLGVWGWMSFD